MKFPRRRKSAKIQGMSLARSEGRWTFERPAERVENLQVRFTFNGEQYYRYENWIEDVLQRSQTEFIGPNDTYNLDFDFDVTYHGVLNQLMALRELLTKPDIFVKANLSEKHGQSMVFVELIDELRKTQQSIEERIK